MEFPQSTFEEVIESERSMVLGAKERYGAFYTHARACSVFLSRSVVGVDHDRMVFSRFFSLMKKHHMLAFLSTLRLHKVQSMMNLRQVLEASAAAAFAIANPGLEHFANVDPEGLLDPSQALTKKRYQWLEANFRSKSDWIKEKKEQINLSTAHANVVSTESVFRVADAGTVVNVPFFDVEDEYTVKADLWLMGSIALTLVDFFYGVNQGCSVIEFCPDFTRHVQQMAQQNESLLGELKSTDRFKRALEKFGTPTS